MQARGQDSATLLRAQVSPMAKQHTDEIPAAELETLMRNAVQVVQDNFGPSHLPDNIRSFLEPISAATFQGMYVTCMLFACAMCALTNGAAIPLWSQRPSPLVLLVFHVAPAQRGKSRLHQATGLLFEVADDVLEQLAREHARTLQTAEADAEQLNQVPVQVKSISIQSCTATELFYRCSCDFAQVQVCVGLTRCVPLK